MTKLTIVHVLAALTQKRHPRRKFGISHLVRITIAKPLAFQKSRDGTITFETMRYVEFTVDADSVKILCLMLVMWQ